MIPPGETACNQSNITLNNQDENERGRGIESGNSIVSASRVTDHVEGERASYCFDFFKPEKDSED